MAQITLGPNQVAILNWKTNRVDIVSLPNPFPVSRYNDVEEWLCCPDGGGYDLGNIDWMSKKE